jgi:exopolysaccharide biosynthesis protein
MRILAFVLALLMLPLAAFAELPVYPYETSGTLVAEHQSDTLWWRIERSKLDEVTIYLTKVCMAESGRQIGKTTADWRENVQDTADLARKATEASLLINASGYVTKRYPEIPENYPGVSEDYYFTPLGSVTVSGGEVFRCLEDVPYYGLTVNTDGLRLHIGEHPLDVLEQQPRETFSFYVECPVIADYESILDPEWVFTTRRAMRNIICKMDEQNYLILTVSNRKKGGLTMQQCVDYLLERFRPEWAYNLDGGPSTALMYRDEKGKLHYVWKNSQENADIMTFAD